MKCFYHLNEDAVATCARCGKSLCRDCASKYHYDNGKILCANCYEEVIKEQKNNERNNLLALIQNNKKHNHTVLFLSAVITVIFVCWFIAEEGINWHVFLIFGYFIMFFLIIETFMFLMEKIPLVTWNCLGQIFKVLICLFASAMIGGTIVVPIITWVLRQKETNKAKKRLAQLDSMESVNIQ